MSIDYAGAVGTTLTLQIMPNVRGTGVYWFPVLLTTIATDKHEFHDLDLPMETTAGASTSFFPIILGVLGYEATDDIYLTLIGWVED